MKALRNVRSAGFTLVEVMVALLVLGVLVGLGMPSFLEMLRNMEIRSAAESVANGLQRARAEAVARNTQVRFVLGTGTSWTVDYVNKPVPTDPPIDSRPSSDSANATMLPEAGDGTAATTVTYNQLGQLLPVNPSVPAGETKPIALIRFAAASGTQGLQVLIGAGGNARVCDPHLSPPNIRAC